MSRNPYASPQAETPFTFSEPQRTSALAITSLVLSILGLISCPFMVLGTLGFLLGIVGLYFVSTSNGRLAGRGLAISGVIVGLLSIVVGMAVWIGMSQMFRAGIGSPVSTMVQGIEATDRSAIRSVLTADADAATTDAEVDAFITQAQGVVGTGASPKAGIMDFARAMIALHETDARYGQSNDTFLAVWVDSDTGRSLVIMRMDGNGRNATPGGLFTNIGVRRDSTEVWLRGSPFP